ncbi:hypothetical protein THASP1DRAFT_24564 [Thamnocephalis sphaerospora]|uniref:Protein YOP1 n=1 Tax=Thamnocephalis sphaerospora TaxID=78915 RepID=A0A4P9XPR7_9FUNG|nr:hypothetical protein THASP1DRAFT_24564 [Thamnocephalis sphaerospora]|eukprot:RKP07260.1 hypothetical protein THASP1DRAFT_24564 [Thamnocephalis sphaerospora]
MSGTTGSAPTTQRPLSPPPERTVAEASVVADGATSAASELLRVAPRMYAWLDAAQQRDGPRLLTIPRNALIDWLRRHCVTRVDGLERLLVLNPLSRLFVSLGFSPVHLFLLSAFGCAVGLRWMYRETRGLLLTLVGVLYPIHRTWRLLGRMNRLSSQTLPPPAQTNATAIESEAGTSGLAARRTVAVAAWAHEARRWLAYWVVFAVLQLAEHWNKSIQEQFSAYHPIKLALLYWLQCPVSRGAEQLGTLSRLRGGSFMALPRRDRDDHGGVQAHAHIEQAHPAGASLPAISAYTPDSYMLSDTSLSDDTVDQSQMQWRQRQPWQQRMAGDEWAAVKQRLMDELTSRPAWRDPSSVLNAPATPESPEPRPINYAAAVANDATFYPPAELMR